MNEHATKVLDTYLDTEELSVPHAILVEGKWGSGKTYFLKNVYEPDRRKRMESRHRHHVPFLFVSLFGASSAYDVEMRIYKAACPAEAIAGSIAGTIALGIGEFLRVKDTTKGALDKLGKKAIKRLNDFVFVFDDLERMEKKAFGEVMGLVNSLVADHERRVILVTDENKLLSVVDRIHWKDQNEKIVGRRAHIEADFESVLRESVKNIKNTQSKKLISENFEYILEITKASKIENLRNIQWGIHNIVAFSSCHLSDTDIPVSHIVRTIGLVFATTLWLRSGLLNTETLEKIPRLSVTLVIKSLDKKDDVPLDADLEKAKNFRDTFPFLSVEAPPVDYKFIRNFESSGVLDCAEVNLWIKSQFGFGAEFDEPSWRRLWHSNERPIAETESAIAALKSELTDRVYTDQGRILHAAGLALRQRAVNDQRLTDHQDEVEFFERYIDEIAAKGLLEPSKIDPFEGAFESYAGLGFCSSDTPEFKEIAYHLRKKSKDAAVAHLQAQAEFIISEAEAGDLEALMKLVRNDNYELTTKPILKDIPTDRLAKLMTRDVPALNAGAKLLAYRYHRARSGDPLLSEIYWAREVHSAVLEKLKLWDDPHKSLALKHLNNMIEYYDRDKQPDDRIILTDEKTEDE